MLKSLPNTGGHDHEFTGYTVAYEREDLQFPVYLVTLIAIAFFAAAVVKDIVWLALPGVAAAAYAYYNLPLVETGRPRLGAGQYGIFLEGLGLVPWRAVTAIETVTTYVHGASGSELHIALKRPVSEVLLADWRKRPLARKLMRRPWSLKSPSTIRIPLDILDRPADEITANLTRMWTYYGGE